MDNLFAQATPLLMFLLPGFLASWVFYALTSHPKPGQFERTAGALVSTFVVHVATRSIQVFLIAVGDHLAVAPWTADSEIIWSAAVAILLGSIAAASTNKDVVHTWLRSKGFTSVSSHPSEWFSVLDSTSSYIVLQLQDGRRLTGWPKEWPTDPARGQFYIQAPAWILDDGCFAELSPLDGILIHATEVRWIEIFPNEAVYDDSATQRV